MFAGSPKRKAVGTTPAEDTTSEWTPFYSKSPDFGPGFSHTTPSFLLLPAKATPSRGPLLFCGLQSFHPSVAPRAPHKPAPPLHCFAAPPLRWALIRVKSHKMDSILFKKPGLWSGLFSYHSVLRSPRFPPPLSRPVSPLRRVFCPFWPDAFSHSPFFAAAGRISSPAKNFTIFP